MIGSKYLVLKLLSDPFSQGDGGFSFRLREDEGEFLVSECVVEVLEIIDIEHHDRKRMSIPTGPFRFRFELRMEMPGN
jgi:hypothetical protein